MMKDFKWMNTSDVLKASSLVWKNNSLRQGAITIWRAFKRVQLSKQNVFLDHSVRFNRSTNFGHYCHVHKRCDITDSSIGSYTYIGPDCTLSNCRIGKFCSIAESVKVVASTHPTRDFVSTSPVFHSIQKQCGICFVDERKFSEILSVQGKSAIIGNDVWIGGG